MLGLPKSAEMSKQLPKKAIYEKFNMNTAGKEKLDADISRLSLIAEISPNSTNITAGETVSSIFVLLVILKNKEFDVKNISMLSKLVDQNIVFVLEYENEQRLAVFRNKVFMSDWKKPEELTLHLKGLNLDTVWENIINDLISNEELEIENKGLSIDEKIELIEKKRKLQKEIARLEKQARAEKQPNKKFELHKTIERLRGNL